MATVAEIFGMRDIKSGDLGIEIETEAPQPGYIVPAIKGWTHKPDGSLRDYGVEYITKEPIKIDSLTEHLKTWKTSLGLIHGTFNNLSVSTSVHVHLNVQGLTPLQVLNFYLTAILFENVMSKYAGPDREGNLFCLRTVDAENIYERIKRSAKRAVTEKDLLASFNPTGQPKLYTNIHTVPIKQLGTVEFRVMRGTTDVIEIEAWTKVLYNIREFSKKFANPVEILRYVKEFGSIGVMREVFDEHFERFYYNGVEKDITVGLLYLADFACCRKSWDLVASKPKNTEDPYGLGRLVAGRAQAIGVDENGHQVIWDVDFEEIDM